MVEPTSRRMEPGSARCRVAISSPGRWLELPADPARLSQQAIGQRPQSFAIARYRLLVKRCVTSAAQEFRTLLRNERALRFSDPRGYWTACLWIASVPASLRPSPYLCMGHGPILGRSAVAVTRRWRRRPNL